MSTLRPVRLGTRGSQLAVAQSGTVADALRRLGVPVEVVRIQTEGDQRRPDTAWGEGAFVGALEQALLDGAIDLAVHSAKDVPTTEDPRLTIAAFPPREDPRDALVTADRGLTLATLPRGARVGTDSPRRTAFILATRPDLRPHPLHGNVDTRLRRLDMGETDALVLAVAGLTRLGLGHRIVEILSPDAVPPAPGQGALAVQCRSDDESTLAWVARLDDHATRAAVETERAFLRASGGGCRAPIGALAEVRGGMIVLTAGSAGPELDGAIVTDTRPAVARGSTSGPIEDRVQLAATLAVRLADDLAASRPPMPNGHHRPGRPRVLVTRAAPQARPLVEALTDAGMEVVAIPTIEVRPVVAGSRLDAEVTRLAGYEWVVVTSPNGAEAVHDAVVRARVDPASTRWAAVGSTTTAVLTRRGVDVALTPSRSSGDGIADELRVSAGGRVLLARGDLADARLPERLRAAGAVVDEVVAYHTVEAPDTSRDPLRRAMADGPFDAIVFSSGSTVRGLLALLSPQERRNALRSLACCIGPSTGRVAREAGFGRVVEAPMQDAAALAALVVAELRGGVAP